MENVFANVRKRSPLVHCITNYVTVNDCANILLACGASPVMADDIREVGEIVAISSALVVNIGTLNERTCEAMIAAGRKANELGKPVVFDPVGAGASKLRTDFARRFLDEVRVSVIRGNISEIKALAESGGASRGVDACEEDRVTEENLDRMVGYAKAFAKRARAVLAITGAIDVVTDGETANVIRRGHPMMASVTGTGCQLTAMTGAFVGANPDNALAAATAAVEAMGRAGEIAFERLTPQDGNSSYRNYIIDAVYHLGNEGCS